MSQSQTASGKDKLSSLLSLIGPFILLWSFFWLVPLIGSFEQSFEASPQSIEKPDLNVHSAWLNYERAFKDTKFIKSLENTLLFVGSTVAITLLIGFFLASALFGLTKLTRGICLFVLLSFVSFSCLFRFVLLCLFVLLVLFCFVCFVGLIS